MNYDSYILIGIGVAISVLGFFLKRLKEEVDGFKRSTTRTQIELAKLGMRNYIRTVLDNVRKVPSDMQREARELDQFLRLTSSENARRKIVALMGDDATSGYGGSAVHCYQVCCGSSVLQLRERCREW